MDETRVPVRREEDRKDTQKSSMWLAAREACRDSSTRKAETIDECIEGFSGYLQTDGYAGYDSAVTGRTASIQVGYFAHVRRKFFEAQKTGVHAKSAAIGIQYSSQLYAIDNELRGKLKRDELGEHTFLAQRKERSVVVLEKFRKYLGKRSEEVLTETLLGKAVGYTVNQWDKLIAYLDCAELTPDNNSSENAIRPFFVGRKNWLFYKSPVGAGDSLYIVFSDRNRETERF